MNITSISILISVILAEYLSPINHAEGAAVPRKQTVAVGGKAKLYQSNSMHRVDASLHNLYEYCRRQDWQGYDPFDGLKSDIFRSLHFLYDRRLLRMIFLQLNKKSLFNLRPFLKIRKGRNAKGLGLFLSGLLNQHQRTRKKEDLDWINRLIEWLMEDRRPGFSGSAWGYDFDWQSRAFFLPAGTPTVVATSFVGRAFLKASRLLGRQDCREVGLSACEFITKDLNRLEEQDSVCFSYSPRDRYFLHNTTALAASLLAMAYKETGESRWAQEAKKAVRYVIKHQSQDGCWAYGENRVARKTGTDSFHTGFILEGLKIYTDCTQDHESCDNIANGLRYYQKNFFTEDGRPKYFPGRNYPFDIHCAAQAVVTLIALKGIGADQAICRRVVEWMIEDMQSPEGYFYYQKGRFLTNRIPYMRWGQAWAFLALSTYLLEYDQ